MRVLLKEPRFNSRHDICKTRSVSISISTISYLSCSIQSTLHHTVAGMLCEEGLHPHGFQASLQKQILVQRLSQCFKGAHEQILRCAWTKTYTFVHECCMQTPAETQIDGWIGICGGAMLAGLHDLDVDPSFA